MPFPLAFQEAQSISCRFALSLYDGFSGANALQGAVSVGIDGQRTPIAKQYQATWVFLSLPDGNYNISVVSDSDTPYYQPVTVPVTLPVTNALWPGYPDNSLADPNLLLDDPAQTAAYIAQRKLATLMPTASYPFPAGTTLVRGTILAGGVPLADATVLVDGGTEIPYVTSSTGEYVLVFDSPQGLSQTVTLRAQHAAKADVTAPVTVQRGRTETLNISMAP